MRNQQHTRRGPARGGPAQGGGSAVQLTVATPAQRALADGAFEREERSLTRLRRRLERWDIPTAPVDALLAEVKRYRAALAPQRELGLADAPAARRPAPRAPAGPAPRAVQTDWLAELEARHDALAEHFTQPTT